MPRTALGRDSTLAATPVNRWPAIPRPGSAAIPACVEVDVLAAAIGGDWLAEAPATMAAQTHVAATITSRHTRRRPDRLISVPAWRDRQWLTLRLDMRLTPLRSRSSEVTSDAERIFGLIPLIVLGRSHQFGG